MKEIKIEKNSSGGRLDRLLFKYLNAAPAGFIYKMLRKKNIVLNDKKASGSEILKEGDVIKLYLADETIEKFKEDKAPAVSASPSAKEIKPLIVYEDENIIALNKPAGMLVQKARPGDVSLNDLLLAYLGTSETFTPGIANRLDRNTAGLVLAGKSLSAGRILNEAIKNRSLKKTYLALVCAEVTEGAYLKGYILKDEKTNRSQAVNALPESGKALKTPEGAKLIETAYRPLASNGRFSLLEVDLITGRSHQIRAQLSAAKLPVAGDYKYGNKEINDKIKSSYGLKAQFLCAYKTEFTAMEGMLSYLNGSCIEAPLPKTFAAVLKGENLWLPGLQEACGALPLKR